MFIPHPRPFLHSQLIRSQKQTFLFETEVSAKFASPEDTILAKLELYRLGGEVSERQWRDILGVLKIRSGTLDLSYLRKWADVLEVNKLLERALKELDLYPKTQAQWAVILQPSSEMIGHGFDFMIQGFRHLRLNLLLII